MLALVARRPIVTLFGAIMLVTAIANPAAAPPGDLDTTFGTGGKVTTDFAGDFDRAAGVAIQGDGKIVAAGFAFVSGTGFDFALARYNTDGSLDPTFGTGGRVTTDFAGGFDQARGVVLQGDGKIVAAGTAFVSGTADFALARYNTDGSLDTSFGTGGKVTTGIADLGDDARGVALQADGKIVAAGQAVSVNQDDFALARYNTDGSLDTSFGTGGKVTTDFAGDFDGARGVSIQGDGKIVAVGVSQAPEPDFALARYNPDGSLDTTFGTGGQVTTDFAGSFDQALGVALQGDGKIMAAGLTDVTGTFDFDFALARYKTDGSLDPTFGTGGRVTTDFAGGDDQASAVAIQGDGRIVAPGLALVSGSNDFALARYNTNGSLDTTFSGNGLVTTDFVSGSGDEASAVAIQGDGKLVAAGMACFTSGCDFALARYTALSEADLSVAKSDSSDPAFVGRNFNYTVVVTNSGPGDVQGVRVMDTLPASVTFVSVSSNHGTCMESSGTVTCELGMLGSGTSASVTIQVTPRSAGTITNVASVEAESNVDPIPATNTDSEQTRVCRRTSRPSSVPCP